MMKNEKAPNLRNYEKVARTATNVIGMQFHEEKRKKKIEKKREKERENLKDIRLFSNCLYVFQSLECVVR